MKFRSSAPAGGRGQNDRKAPFHDRVADDIRILDRQYGNAEIDAAVADLGHDVVDRQYLELDPRVGMPLAKTPDRLRNQSLRHARAGDDMHRANAVLAQLLREVIDPQNPLVHLLGLVIKTPRLGCRLVAPHYALEEFEAEPILGVGKKPADSRLRHSEEP